MKRIRMTLCGLAFLGIGTTSLWAQESDWQPVNRHAARYQDPASISLIGKPIVGSKTRVDRQIEPARYAPGEQFSLPLPLAPAGRPNDYEAASYPQTVIQPGKNQLVQQPPAPQIPGSTPSKTEQIQVPPTGVIVQGPVAYGGSFVPGEMGIEGIEYGGFAGDRFYLSAPHGSPGRWYGSLEYLLWTISGDKTPPLVTTGPQESNGILGQPGVSVLYGGDIDTDALSGGRVTMGVWFNRCQTWGMVGSFFTTGKRYTNFVAASDGDPLLARPFFNIANGLEDSELVARTGILSGSVAVESSSQLTGADLNFRFNLWNNYGTCRKCHWHLDGYAGVKYLGLSEDLKITEDLLAGPQSASPGARFLVRDRFGTDNDFIGANLGIMSEWRLGRFFFGMRSGIGIGGTNQTVVIKGTTTITPAGGASVTQTGGLLALPSNIGTYHRNVFSVVPEFGVNLGLQVTDHLRVFIGYDLTYWSNVARPGQQLDRSVNPTQLPTIDGPGTLVGDPRPAFRFQNSNAYIQGLSAGLQWIF